MSASSRRLEMLLVDHATEGLDPISQAEMRSLLSQSPGLDPESFELAAAAIELACDLCEDPLPSSLRSRLSLRARDLRGPAS